ncbi:outer membrane biosynthesis protein TonB [Rhodoligotrophos appendicifer]|uniref:TonB C-terminal domain-containing protein n=1 Tax=Rhodoligotrophos appendicifer TaxID=987056 RepID=UPI0011861FCA|nr:TonB C-terminal domain-containing protein [Rhodoligotrophos appendicifer]
MRWSITTSFLLHVALLMACVIALPSAEEFHPETPPAVPVELLTLSDLSKRMAVQKDAEEKPEEKAAPPKPPEEVKKAKPKPEPAPEPTEAAKAPAPEPEPEPKPVEQATAEPMPQPSEPTPAPEQAVPDAKPEPDKVPEKKAETPPPPKPKAKPKPPAPKVAEKKPQRDFNPDDIAALLNKIPDAQSAAADTPVETGAPKRAERTAMIGSDSAITADERDWLRSQIEKCWNPPVGVSDAQNLIVKLRIAFNMDGSVVGYPEIMNSGGSPLFQVAADSAVRAVMRCAPYQMPQEKYESWRDVILNFDPSHMFPS